MPPTHAHAAPTELSGDAIVLKCDDTFLLSDSCGDVQCEENRGLGLFYRDTRFLKRYELRLQGEPLISLSSQHGGGDWVTHVLENRSLASAPNRTAAHRISVQRDRTAGDGTLGELIVVTNYDQREARFELQLHFEADFVDIFQVRSLGDHDPGEPLTPRIGADRVCLGARGTDGWERSIELIFTPQPTQLERQLVRFDLALEPRQSVRVEVHMTLSVRRGAGAGAGIAGTNGDSPAPRRRAPDPGHLDEAAPQGQAMLDASAQVCGHPVLEKILRRSLLDLSLLRGTLTHDLHYIAAGVPWYVTLFGRDSALSALQLCAYRPEIAGQTVRLLAHYQAREHDTFREAQPGKILHELRRGQLAHLHSIPQSPAYYGSVDSTLLFIIVLDEYVGWSGDVAIVRELHSALAAALTWIERYGDSDGDGYIDYGARDSAAAHPGHRLANQGWKDSGDAICNADGSLVQAPVALCEVQGYLYRAWRSAARLLRLINQDSEAARLERLTQALQERFERDYWSEELGCYLLARQQGGRPAAVVSSNAGQVLWSGISSAAHAQAVIERMMAPDMFSGWGVRTLSSRERRYNPLSYHLGSVWPHDNSLLCAGCVHYGAHGAARRIFDALFDAASGFRDHRMPELYCGFPRRAEQSHPVRYPVACSPQAWAAGAIPYALMRLLGLQPDAPDGCLRILEPCLPEWLERLSVNRLRVGAACADLRFERDAHGLVQVGSTVREGSLRIETLRK